MLSRLKISFFLIVSSLIIVSCSESFEDSDTIILGHAGMGIADVYPWNSYESVSKAMYLPSDGVEIDIQLSSDSVWFAYHGSDLSKETDGYGPIHTLTSGIITKDIYGLPLN
jgi:glycerophosphoryl diester phosphodiesterase